MAAVQSAAIEPKMMIGGEPLGAADGRTYEVFEPAVGEVMALAPDAGAADIDAAVQAGRGAAAEWKRMGAVARAERVAAFGRDVRAHARELALIDSRNSGNPLSGTLHGALKGAQALEFFAGLAMELTGRTIPATQDHLHYTLREPFGVVGVITAYNHPALFACARTSAALVAGNCVVLKPAVQTPLSAIRLSELAQEHFPPGVFNVVTGGAEAGSALVRHPDVPRIAFTGSMGTAIRIQADAASSGTIKRLSFELGGKNPLIILPDITAERAADGAVEGMNLLKVLGQSCGSTSRAFVHQDVYQAFITETSDRLSALRFGPPEEETTQLGSLVSAQQRDKVEHYVEVGKQDGARLVLGGTRPTDPPYDRGYYYPPTLFTDARPEMRIAREEIFGPVLTVIPWSDEREMLNGVNSVPYGLTASIFTDDLKTAHRMAAEVESGYVWINDVEKRWLGVPFGGFKNSGTASELSIEELFSNTQTKSVSVSLA